jgi:hypothetical protein
MTTADEQPSRAPWERIVSANGQGGESDVAFAAFGVYCKMPEGEDAIRLLAQTLPKSRTLLERWSVRYQWQQRRRAWRDHLARLAHKAVEQLECANAAKWAKRREQEREDQHQDTQLLRRKARQMFDYPLSEQTARGPDGKTVIVKPVRWSMDTGATLMRTAADIGRRATEEHSPDVHDEIVEKIELESSPMKPDDDEKEPT